MGLTLNCHNLDANDGEKEREREREREMKEWKKGKISDDCVCGSRFSTQKKTRQEKEKCIRNENEM